MARQSWWNHFILQNSDDRFRAARIQYALPGSELHAMQLHFVDPHELCGATAASHSCPLNQERKLRTARTLDHSRKQSSFPDPRRDFCARLHVYLNHASFFRRARPRDRSGMFLRWRCVLHRFWRRRGCHRCGLRNIQILTLEAGHHDGLSSDANAGVGNWTETVSGEWCRYCSD